MQERNLSKALTTTQPMHYIGSQIFWLCARTRCLSICAPSFVAVVWCKWALRVIVHFERCELSRLKHGTCTKLYPVTLTSRKLTSGKLLSYILLFKCGVPSELKCSVGNRTWKVVGSKDNCPHKKGKVMGHNCRVANMTICSSLLQMNWTTIYTFAHFQLIAYQLKLSKRRNHISFKWVGSQYFNLSAT